MKKCKLPGCTIPVVYSYNISKKERPKIYDFYLALPDIYAKGIRTYSTITSTKSPSFSWQLSAQVSQILRSSLLQSRDYVYEVMDEYGHLQLSESQKHTDLHAHEFSRFPDLWY